MISILSLVMAEITAGTWFQQNFVQPILEQGVAGYNIVNTAVYGIIFALAVFGVYKLLQRLKINIDRKFLLGITPFIIMGSVFRVIRDAKIYESWVFVSPIIYMFIFVVALLALLLAIGVERFAERKLEKWYSSGMAVSRKQSEILQQRPAMRLLKFLSDYHKLWAIIGIIIVIAGLIMLSPIGISNWPGIGFVVLITAVWCAILLLIYKSKKLKLFSKENTGILGVHLFDATTTFVAVGFFGYYEQHVVSSAAISLVGPIAQFALKIVVVLAVLWALDKYLKGKENENLRNFLKIAIIILGLAPGLRNFTRLGLGV